MEIGEQAALGAAIVWTFSSMLWGKLNISAIGINLCKNWIGSAMLLVHMLIVSLVFAQPLLETSTRAWILLGASGLIGIVVGDTLYFRSLQILGPRRALIMACTSPIFAAALGWLFLREQLGFIVLSGVCLTVIGVIVVVLDRKAKVESPGLLPGNVGTGIACGTVGAICQAVGGLLSKFGMESQAGADASVVCSPLEATFIRLFIAAVATLAIVVVSKQLKSISSKITKDMLIRVLIPATALGTWLGIWLSQIAYQKTDLAIAQTLLSTCPLFAIPVVWYFHGHRVTIYSIAGTIVALVGIYLAMKY